MPLTHVVVLAILQGVTEFLPVSSSAHLILPGRLLNWPDQGLAFDVAVHMGTLFAVIIYYFYDLIKIAAFTIESVIKRRNGPVSRVGWYLITATVPVAVVGFFVEDFVSTAARSIEIIAYATIFFGLLLGAASYINRRLCWRTLVKAEGQRSDSLRHMTWQQAIIIGLAQTFALIPGTSRSGITLTAGLFLGLRPEAAARFSFLLSIPVIFASGALEGYKLYETGFAGAGLVEMLIGGIIAFVAALCVIHFFMKFIAKSGMGIFVLYRLILGFGLLYFFCW